MKRIGMTFALLTALSFGMAAQQTLTLEDCRRMALENNKELDQARTKVEMAGYDRKIALANYFPNISATGAWLHNGRNLSLLPEDVSNDLTGMGTTLHGMKEQAMAEAMQAIQSNPELAQQLMQNPDFLQLVQKLQGMDYSEAINQIGSDVDKAFTIDIENVYVGVVSLQQPLFMGGKIIAANKIARLAEELARTQYDQKYQEMMVDVDQSYWQIVSVANKLELAESYADLLHQMERDVQVAIDEGVSTESDGLQIKVKANEADMLRTKARNGLTLAKMLLCQRIGLPLDTDITLADEKLDAIPVPQAGPVKDMESIYADRPETRSLDLAARIYDGKVNVARADMMPKVILMANYLVTNPNMYHSYQKKFDGMWNAGVLVNIPIFHGFEALNKTRKAKAEATLYRTQLEDAREMINLQVTQLRKQRTEAEEKLAMAESNLENAEENLRKATIGFEAGVVETNVALAAQTAWLQAHSEFIDAGIELQMNQVALGKAEGNYHVE